MDLVLQNELGDELSSFANRLSNASDRNLSDFSTEYLMDKINVTTTNN